MYSTNNRTNQQPELKLLPLSEAGQKFNDVLEELQRFVALALLLPKSQLDGDNKSIALHSEEAHVRR